METYSLPGCHWNILSGHVTSVTSSVTSAFTQLKGAQEIYLQLDFDCKYANRHPQDHANCAYSNMKGIFREKEGVA